MSNIYCNNLNGYSRFQTREVWLGDVAMGAQNPIRIQSMTTTNTLDTFATVEQSIRMIEAGCEFVRITAPSVKEAENLKNIKAELKKRGYTTPIIADIHFTPNAAEVAARLVEKVRINPGNYVDKKKFETLSYSELEYQAEIERIRAKFIPLIKICKEYGTAMRIGTNHGSLSDRILSRYGDTPLGMVESAMEFIRICAEENYHNLVLSMKASNTRVMVQAYRLLVKTMMEHQMNYPLHLGVTEAGEAEDGRIKSAVGIGTLLAEGLGDTIRVSLTEAPEAEIPVARRILTPFLGVKDQGIEKESFKKYQIHPFDYQKRKSHAVLNIGDHHAPIVIADYRDRQEIKPASFFGIGHQYSIPLDKWSSTDQAADYVFVGDQTVNFEVPGHLGIIQNLETWKTQKDKKHHYPYLSTQEYLLNQEMISALNFIEISSETDATASFHKLRTDPSVVLVLKIDSIYQQRRVLNVLIQEQLTCPVVLSRNYVQLESEQFITQSSTELGALLVDGLGDGIWMHAQGCGSDQLVNQTAFGILQATRTRISKTEYISCPSCGRTLFDLQETTAKIRAVTHHLKGIKIGIMGCIVNGPGEMADADYGYVGTGPGKITLYKEKEVIQKNVPEQEAVQALIALIQKYGDWVDAP